MAGFVTKLLRIKNPPQNTNPNTLLLDMLLSTKNIRFRQSYTRVLLTVVNWDFPLEFTGSPTQIFCLLGAGEIIQVIFGAFEKVEK